MVPEDSPDFVADIPGYATGNWTPTVDPGREDRRVVSQLGRLSGLGRTGQAANSGGADTSGSAAATAASQRTAAATTGSGDASTSRGTRAGAASPPAGITFEGTKEKKEKGKGKKSGAEKKAARRTNTSRALTVMALLWDLNEGQPGTDSIDFIRFSDISGVDPETADPMEIARQLVNPDLGFLRAYQAHEGRGWGRGRGEIHIT